MNIGANFGRRAASPWGPGLETGGDASGRTRHAELLILCARIDFTP